METRSVNEKASQDTLISLLQLDPSPIESPLAEDAPDREKDLPPLPDDREGSDGNGSLETSGKGLSASSLLGLSGSGGRGSIYYCLFPYPFAEHMVLMILSGPSVN